MPHRPLSILHKQAVSLQGLCPGETLEYVHQLISTRVFLTAHLLLAKNTKAHQWENKYTVVYAEYNIHFYSRKRAATGITDNSQRHDFE